MIMSLFHPGDLGAADWAKVLGVLFLLVVVPVFIVGFIFYKIATRRSERFRLGLPKRE